jgi:hypothetical protein
MKRKVLVGFISIILLAGLMGCATLQQKWEKATDDERARIIVSQTQKSLKTTAVLTAAVVEKNPQYKNDWKTKVLPMIESANNILGDLIKKGQAGQKLTYLEVLAAVGGRVTDIIAIVKGWGVNVTELELIERRLSWITYSGEPLL